MKMCSTPINIPGLSAQAKKALFDTERATGDDTKVNNDNASNAIDDDEEDADVDDDVRAATTPTAPPNSPIFPLSL